MTLLAEARRLRDMAHAPYSGFQVGAALRSGDGRIFAGCNVENAAYPEGLCAEAGAIAAMVAGGAREIAEILVIADSPAPVPPCGGCRQKIAEFATAQTLVTMATLDGQCVSMRLSELLPGAFGPQHMDRS